MSESQEQSEEIQNEPVIMKEDSKRGSKYDTPEVVSYIVQEKNKNKPVRQITDELRARGYEKISPAVVSQLYDKATARSVVQHNVASETFTDYSGEIKTLYDESIKLMGDYVKNLRQINEEISKSVANGDIESLQGKTMVMKYIATGVTIIKEIREHVNLQMELQDKITNTMEKEYSLDATAIYEKFNKYLKSLESNKQITILDPALK